MKTPKDFEDFIFSQKKRAVSTHESQPSSPAALRRPSAELSYQCRKRMDTLPLLSALRKGSERDQSSNYLYYFIAYGREKTDVKKYSLIKIVEAKSVHSRMSAKERFYGAWMQKNRKNKLWTVTQAQGSNHKEQLASLHGHQEGHIPENLGQGLLVLWFNSLRGTEGTRGQHHHV